MTEFYSLDISDNIIEEEDKNAVKIFKYDEQNKVQSFKVLDKNRNFVFGKRFDYNKEGTHIIREFPLSENGFGKIEDFDVEGIEYDLGGDETLPILQIFINENKQFKTCNDGYYAIRTWEDDKERIIKQLYYDYKGEPMISNDGIFGIKVEYIDEQTTKSRVS